MFTGLSLTLVRPHSAMTYRHLLLPLVLASLSSTAQAQNPNDPGLLDPVIYELLQRPWRLPSSHQVTGHSEQINLVGRVKKRRADQGESATDKPISAQGTNSPNRDLRTALRDLDDASANQNQGGMTAAAVEMQGILTGSTQGRIYDGFSMLNTHRGGWLPDHLPGEFRSKEVKDRGRRATGLDGVDRVVWEVDVNLLYFDEEMDCDTAFLVFSPQADFRDLLYINYTVYSTTTESFAPTTLLHDVDPFGAGELPSKGYDAVWVPLGSNEITELTIDHGSIGTIHGIQVWGWYAQPDRSVYLQPVWESLDPITGLPRRDPRGATMMAQMAGQTFDSIGDAAVEKKLWSVADSVMQGASAASIQAILTQVRTGPLGDMDQWQDELENRNLFPQEALDLLALEGIDPHVLGPNRLGTYDAILVYANHELYMDSLDAIEGHDPLTGEPVPLPNDAQGENYRIKVFNLDSTTHFLQSFDYGPALHDDIATCRIAPSGGHSLEVFAAQPVQGTPKMNELQWRTGWGLRQGLGTVPQFDVFTQAADQPALQPFNDEHGSIQLGWQYPSPDRGADWRVSPPADWLNGTQDLEEGGLPGVIIGTATPGFGVAKMPTGDLSGFHPDGLKNADTDADGVADSLLFPDWLRNPDSLQGDLIPATKEWQPFLFLNPQNGTMFLDPQNPSQGLWAEQTYVFGQPLAPGANQVIEFRRPRTQAQALWHTDGLFRGSTGAPSRTNDVFTR